MVGVPGRSKGCNTCRKRRILCTLERPQCAQCIKSKRLCAGYQRERVFIVNSGLPEKSSATVTETLSKEITPESETDGRNAGTLSLVRKGDAYAKLNRIVTAKMSFGQEVLPNSAYSQQLLGNFLGRYFPTAKLGTGEETPWILLLPDLPEPTVAMELSLLAISSAKLGRVNSDPALVRESLRLYSRGLHELQKALWAPALMYRDETLAACMLLSLYEIMECPGQSKQGYVSHCNGCATLIRLRGVDRCMSGLGHKMFVAFRIQATLQALENREVLFLSEPLWVERPWKLSPKSPYDHLLDLLLLGPNLLKQADNLKNLTSVELLLATLHLIHQCWELDVGLQKFYNELEEIALGPMYWPEFAAEDNAADDPDLGKLFPIALHFPNPRIARTVLLYWATLAMLWPGMAALYGLIATIQLDPTAIASTSNKDFWDKVTKSLDRNQICDRERIVFETSSSTPFDLLSKLPPLGERVDIMPFVRNICQSVEYHMKGEMAVQGPALIAAPLNIVIETLENLPGRDRELAWARNKLGRIRGTGLLILKEYDTVA